MSTLTHLLGANLIVRQKIVKGINASSTRADLLHISSPLHHVTFIPTHSTRASGSAAKRRRNTSRPEKNRGTDTASRSYDRSTLEQIAVVGLDGEADSVSDFLLVAASEGVGGCGGQGGEGGDGDDGEMHGGGS
jgi:hypothetical protein